MYEGYYISTYKVSQCTRFLPLYTVGNYQKDPRSPCLCPFPILQWGQMVNKCNVYVKSKSKIIQKYLGIGI